MVDSRLTPEVTESLAVRWEPVYRSQLHYLVTWGTRGRRPVLKNRHVRSLQNLIQQLCAELLPLPSVPEVNRTIRTA